MRAGHAAPIEGVNKDLSAMEHFRGGIGVQVSRYRADSTLAPFGDLGLTQRFTLCVTFAVAGKLPKNLEPHAEDRTTPAQISALLL